MNVAKRKLALYLTSDKLDSIQKNSNRVSTVYIKKFVLSYFLTRVTRVESNIYYPVCLFQFEWLVVIKILTLSCRSTYLVPILRNFITLLPET